MSRSDWLFLVVAMVEGGIVAFAMCVMLAEMVARLGRRWGNGK